MRQTTPRSWQSASVVIVWRRRDRLLRRQIGDSADQSGRDFSRARLVALDLRRKSLRDCNLEYADLTEADLTGADLRGANLHGAYLTGTIFTGANLAGARLDEAMMMATDFTDAVLADVTMEGTIWDQAITWPSGFAPKMGDVGLWRGRTRRSNT